MMRFSTVFLVLFLSSCIPGFIGTSSYDYAKEIQAEIDSILIDSGKPSINWDSRKLESLSSNYNRAFYAVKEYHVSRKDRDEITKNVFKKLHELLEEEKASQKDAPDNKDSKKENKDAEKKSLLDDPEALLLGVTEGIFTDLDPYTRLRNPAEFKRFNSFGREKLSGIGIRVRPHDLGLTVIEVMEQSGITPDKLKRGDIIISADDQDLKDLTLEDMVHLIRGKSGTKVTLGLLFADSTTVKREFTRQDLETSPLSWRLEKAGKKDVAVINIYNFPKNLDRDFEKAIDKANNLAVNDIDSLIIDLRGNPGGLLEEAVNIIDNLMSTGVAVTVISREATRERKVSRRTIIPENIPVYIMINESSASASEVVAGKLQLSKRAKIFGKPSFGKTSVQYITSLLDGYGLTVTSAKYFPGNIEEEKTSTFEKVSPDVEGEDDISTLEDELLQKILEEIAKT